MMEVGHPGVLVESAQPHPASTPSKFDEDHGSPIFLTHMAIDFNSRQAFQHRDEPACASRREDALAVGFGNESRGLFRMCPLPPHSTRDRNAGPPLLARVVVIGALISSVLRAAGTSSVLWFPSIINNLTICHH
jgi:hypothetical protein